MLSRGWIRAAGHYYSQVAKEAKDMIFPTDYDATKMFWLINKSGAHGARSGLLPLAKEILIGIVRGRGKVSNIRRHANLTIPTISHAIRSRMY